MGAVRVHLSALLVEKGLLTPEQVTAALERQRTSGEKLGEVCVGLGFLTEDQLADALEIHLGVPRVRLGTYLIEADALGIVPAPLARRHGLIPLFRIHNTLTVAMADPSNVYAIDELQQLTGMDVDTVLATRREVDEGLRRHYGAAGPIQEVVAELDRARPAGPTQARETGQVQAQDAPVIKLVNMLLSQAVGEAASDLHLEPFPGGVRARIRVDGALHEISTFPAHMHAAVMSRMKVMAHLDIAERRIPQDGRMQFGLAGRNIDLRVSTYPTYLGEKLVVRVLDQAQVQIDLEEVGLEPDTLALFKDVIERPTGIVLFTGPTGSGKTTTLYAALRRIASPEKNVMTVEDPIEYFLDVVNQSQVNVRAGLTFASGLRSILRQDPDVIMVGEIRDSETAEVAIRAALTGHLVLSTLHTNDAAGAVTRLIDMGIEPFLPATAVTAVLAQRLVRKICGACVEVCEPAPTTLARLGMALPPGATIRRGRGCAACRETGFAGRTGIFELLRMTPAIEDLVASKARAQAITQHAAASGMRRLREDGVRKAVRGITTLEEVIKVT